MSQDRCLLLLHGRIYGHPGADALLIRGERIAAVKRSSEIESMPECSFDIIDLHGLCVFPGFVDTHLHLKMTGQALRSVDLSACTSIEEVQALLQQALRQRKKEAGFPILLNAMGWHQDRFASRRMLERNDLDSVSKTDLLIAQRACTHVLCANTAAMKAAGVWHENGLFAEDECAPLLALPEQEDRAHLDEILMQAAEHCLNQGLCEVWCCDLKESDAAQLLPHYRKISEILPLTHQVCLTDPAAMRRFLEIWKPYQTGTHRFGAFKGFADGSLGAATAALHEDYLNDPQNRGIETMTPAQMDVFAAACAELNRPGLLHAIGDRAIDHALQAFERHQDPDNTNRFGLLHIQITSPDLLERLKRQKIHAYIQPIFWKADSRILAQRIRPELAASSYAFGTISKNSLTLLSADSPIEDCDPVAGICQALTLPDPLSLEDAIAGYTLNPATAAGREHETGRIEPGYLATLSFFSGDPQDPFTWSPAGVMIRGRLHRPL